MNQASIDTIQDILKPISVSGALAKEDFYELIRLLKDGGKKKQEFPLKENQLLSQAQLAKRWNLCKARIRQHEREGFIKRVPRLKGHPRYRLSDILKCEEGEENKND